MSQNTSITRLQESALQQMEARKEYEKQAVEFAEQLQQRIANYNSVVVNTARKFQSDYDVWAHIMTLTIPKNATFLSYMKHSNEYVFQWNGTTQHVPGHLLNNDPIAVAQYTRWHVRKFQEKRQGERYNEAKSALLKANRALTTAQNAAKKAQQRMDAEEEVSRNHEQRILTRAQKKVEAKNKLRALQTV